MIRAYDARVYDGRVCPECVMAGRASDFPPNHAAMRPIVFVALALLGHEPFRSMLKAAEDQRRDPEGAQRRLAEIQAAIARAKAGLPQPGMARPGPGGSPPRNRKERRAATARSKKARKAARAARRKGRRT